MAKKEKFYSSYENKEIEEILQRSDKKPIVLYYDQANQLYRLFATEERRDAWVNAYTNGEMTDEIAKYEFTESFTAPAPYTINFISFKDNQYILNGTVGTTLEYGFITVDGNGQEVQEAIDAYYTFKTPTGTKQTSNVYNADTTVKMNIDDFLSIGTNSITILIRGRSTGVTKTIVVTYYVVELSLTSNFNIAKAIQPNTNFSVQYTVVGQQDKNIRFYIDGELFATTTVSSLEAEATKIQQIVNSKGGIKPGKHTLQLQAEMQAGDSIFKSNILYFEFVIMGDEEQSEHILVAAEFPSVVGVIVGNPHFSGEQFVTSSVKWAYFSSNPLMQTATIKWKLVTNDGVATSLTTRTADVVSAETDKTPDPITFMPTEIGDFRLLAYIDEKVVNNATYEITVVKNTKGLIETTEGLVMKLTALGRSNTEPENEKNQWTNNGFKSTFANQPWNNSSGWNDDQLWLNDGATCTINCKPFSPEIAAAAANGAVFEIEFETFNCDDEDAPVVEIGGFGNDAHLLITGTSAKLTTTEGVKVETNFTTEERIKLAFIVHPKTGTDYERMLFIQNNGILAPAAQYTTSDNINTEGQIVLGNANGKCGLKVYTIRVYDAAISMYNELNNYIIDMGGKDLQKIVRQNDIYVTGLKQIDVDKLESLFTVVKITGDMNHLIAAGTKNTMTGGLEITCPQDSSINIKCAGAQFSNAGQSTLDLPIPSMHVKLDKNENICYDRDGKPLNKNRWAFKKGNVPEKKFRLQANYMDSSGCHNGAFLKLFNEVSNKLNINGEYVLRIPSIEYAKKKYSDAMNDAHGADPSGSDWKFPYEMSFVPDSIPCVVVWRPDEQSSYKFLGQYVIMDEKKANYANGMHSIYDNITNDNKPDPFKFSTKGGNRLWDNANCYQFEILRNTHGLTLFTSADTWNAKGSDGSNERDKAFEMIYPDEDDLEPDQIQSAWENFYTTFVKPVCDTYKNQAAFNALYGTVLDRWHFAAYYVLMLRNCCVDSAVRNMELITFDGHKWLPKWWDVDMQCGMEQTGTCDVPPTSDRNTIIGSGSNRNYAFAGKNIDENGVITSSWLWDALEACPQFQEDVKTIDDAMYTAGWTYGNMTRVQDQDYVNTWSESLYNESGIVKYIDQFLTYKKDHLGLFLGSMTSHRHWFLKTSYDFYDAKNVCGGYKSRTIYVRTNGAHSGLEMKFKAGATTYYGWGLTNTSFQTGVLAEKGDTFVLTLQIDSGAAALNDPIKIYSASKLEEVDISQIARYAVNIIQLENTYDPVTGTILKKLNVGIPKSDMANGISNNSVGLGFSGLNYMTRVEEFNIQGMLSLQNIELAYMRQLKKFYAAGSGIITFNPADGANFEEIELPTSVRSMTMNGCSLTDSNGDCAISWWKTDPTNYVTTSAGRTPPTSLTYLAFSGMGTDAGTQKFVMAWIKNIAAQAEVDPTVRFANYQLYYSQVKWYDMDIEDLMTIAKIPKAQRQITGYIKCKQEFTSDQMNELMMAFDDTIFNKSGKLIIDCSSRKIIVSGTGSDTDVIEEIDPNTGTKVVVVEILQGTECQLQAVGFPIISETTPIYNWQYIEYDEMGNATYKQGNLENPLIQFGQNKIHYTSGKVTTKEYYVDDETQERGYVDYAVYVRNSVDNQSGNAILRIKNRTYPKYAQISLDEASVADSVELVEGVYQLFATGLYTFSVKHFMEDPATRSSVPYTGTMRENGGTWTVSGYDERYVEIEEQTNTTLKLRVTSLKFAVDQLDLTIRYTSKWNNYVEDFDGSPRGCKVDAVPVQINVVKIITNVLVDDENRAYGNAPLFAIIDHFGFPHERETSYNSYELKKIIRNSSGEIIYDLDFYDTMARLYPPSTLDYRVGRFDSLSSAGYNIPKYLKNMKGLNLDNCYAITEVDIAGTYNFQRVSTRGTNADVIVGYGTSLERLDLGTPTTIDIRNPDVFLDVDNITVENVSRLSSVTLQKFIITTDDEHTYTDDYFHNEFKRTSELIDQGNKPGQRVALKHINLLNTTNIEKFQTGHEIESIASLINTSRYPDRNVLDDSSDINLNVYAEHAYEDEVEALRDRFDRLAIEIGSAYYIRWADREFEKAISKLATKGGFGDGTGVVDSQARSITDFDEALRGNAEIENLSDLYKCANLKFPSCGDAENPLPEESQFYGCTGLQTIAFPERTTKIGAYTFNDMPNLSCLDFSRCTELIRIERNAFNNCTYPMSINLNRSQKLDAVDVESLNITDLEIVGTDIKQLTI